MEKNKTTEKLTRRILRKMIPSAAAILLILAGGLVYLHSGVPAGRTKAVRKTVDDSVTEEGVITSGGELHILSEVAGPVAEILVGENDRVEAGDVLYRIDPVQYRYEKEAAENSAKALEAQLERTKVGQVMTASPQEYLENLEEELESAKAARNAAKSAYEGYRVLAESGDVSRLELERAEAEYRGAESAYRQAEERCRESSTLLEELKTQGIDREKLNKTFYEAETGMLEAELAGSRTQIEQLEDRIGRCEVKASRPGIVSELPIRHVNAVTEGQETVCLQTIDRNAAEADVLTSIVPWLSAGDPVELIFSRKGQDETVEGHIAEIYGFASPGVSALGLSEYRVHIRIEPERPEELAGREGYGVTVTFPLYHREDALTVPADALFSENRQNYVYVVKAGRAVKTAVESEYQSGGDAVILSGLSEGDTVVQKADTEGIRDGARVR